MLKRYEMYNQANINSLPNTEERILVRKYLDCAFLIYIIFGILNILGAISRFSDDIVSAIISIGVGLIFIFGAVKCSAMQKMLSEPTFDWAKLKSDLDYTFCVNIVFSILVGIGFVLNIYSFISLWAYVGNALWSTYVGYVILIYLLIAGSLIGCLILLLTKQSGVKAVLPILGGPANPANAGFTNHTQPANNYAPPQQQPAQVKPNNDNFGNGGFGGDGGFGAQPQQQAQPDNFGNGGFGDQQQGGDPVTPF